METTLENRVRENKTPHPVNQVTSVSKYLALALFVALPFLGGFIGYTYAPIKTVEIEKAVLVKENAPSSQEKALLAAEIAVTDGTVTLTLLDGTKTVIATSVDWEDTQDIFLIQTFTAAIIAPNKKFVALQGIEYEDYFVQVYNVSEKRLEDKIYGQFTGWASDGKLTINSCNLAGEECTRYISVSSDNPSILEKAR